MFDHFLKPLIVGCGGCGGCGETVGIIVAQWSGSSCEARATPLPSWTSSMSFPARADSIIGSLTMHELLDHYSSNQLSEGSNKRSGNVSLGSHFLRFLTSPLPFHLNHHHHGNQKVCIQGKAVVIVDEKVHQSMIIYSDQSMYIRRSMINDLWRSHAKKNILSSMRSRVYRN